MVLKYLTFECEDSKKFNLKTEEQIIGLSPKQWCIETIFLWNWPQLMLQKINEFSSCTLGSSLVISVPGIVIILLCWFSSEP